MKKWHYVVIGILVVIFALGFYLLSAKQYMCWPYCEGMTDQDREILRMQDQIQITSLNPGDTITSPITFTGEARGTWYFEASFPIFIVNWDGLIIGQGVAQAQEDWMTKKVVPFKATITFEKPDINDMNRAYARRGAVIFKKDNPSGLPEHDAAVEIPIVFE